MEFVLAHEIHEVRFKHMRSMSILKTSSLLLNAVGTEQKKNWKWWCGSKFCFMV